MSRVSSYNLFLETTNINGASSAKALLWNWAEITFTPCLRKPTEESHGHIFTQIDTKKVSKLEVFSLIRSPEAFSSSCGTVKSEPWCPLTPSWPPRCSWRPSYLCSSYLASRCTGLTCRGSTRCRRRSRGSASRSSGCSASRSPPRSTRWATRWRIWWFRGYIEALWDANMDASGSEI